ncbi:MAG: 3-deoxy-7-phosphoheptulonate synthase class II [Planctomycetota bacterium]
MTPDWTPESWSEKLQAQQVRYRDRDEVARVRAKLGSLPPLVTSYEVLKLREEIAQAQRGERLILQGGDCAETLADCTSDVITAKLKILLQMSVVLVHGLKKPVTRVGRFAGQYAKPRSSPEETRVVDGTEIKLPSYFGDLVNEAEFSEEAREPRPHLMLRGYAHAAMTLNFIRSLLDGGFADFHHPDHWDLEWMSHARLSDERRAQYEQLRGTLLDGLRFMEAMSEKKLTDLSRVEFFTSHEGLNLLYESAQTRLVPHVPGYFDLTTHLPWIGERTRQLDGAHVEFFRGIENPVGVKLGPKATADDVRTMLEILNPKDTPGKIVLITRMGIDHAADNMPALVEGVAALRKNVLWMSDPMHGNGIQTSHGIKTRSFDDILGELEAVADVHKKAGTVLGGVHFELTGEDVTECVGGASGLDEDGLSENYASPCDPRLNYQQSLELAFLLAQKLS